jgi:hypothetical protein
MIKQTLAAATFLTISAGTMVASAQLALKGSDTLEPVVSDVLANKCATAMLNAVLTYAGGGSGGGNDAMLAGTQVIAPMSSALSNDPTESHCASHPTSAEGMVVGLDGISVVVDASSSEHCGGGHANRPDEPTSAPTPPFSQYRLSGTLSGTAGYVAGAGMAAGTGWKDILLLLYTGIDHSGVKGCNSQARQDLAADYANLFQNGCSANANCPNGIKHAYRRGDLSGTTDTFLGLIGGPKPATLPFCNGSDVDDNDPVRRNCDPSEQVCEYDGTLGLVLPVVVPTFSNDTTVLYNGDKLNAAGVFLIGAGPNCGGNGPTWIVPGVTPAPAALAAVDTNRCDCRFPTPHDFVTAGLSTTNDGRFNWNTRIGGGCQVPTQTSVSTTAHWGLLNGDTGTAVAEKDNTPAAWGSRFNDGTGFQKCCSVFINGVSTHVTEDPRAVNLALRDPASSNGAFKKNTSTSPALTVNFHRIHATVNGKTNVGPNAATSGTPQCQKVDATENIGCLVEFPSDECSVGFAGLDASDKAFAERGAVNAVDPTLATISALISDPPNAYPLARKLYLNSLVGFENLGENATTHTGALNTYAPGTAGTATVNGQYNLAKCFYSDYLDATPSLTKAGFIGLPAASGRPAGKPFCQNACGDTACGSDTASTAVFDGAFSR